MCLCRSLGQRPEYLHCALSCPIVLMGLSVPGLDARGTKAGASHITPPDAKNYDSKGRQQVMYGEYK